MTLRQGQALSTKKMSPVSPVPRSRRERLCRLLPLEQAEVVAADLRPGEGFHVAVGEGVVALTVVAGGGQQLRVREIRAWGEVIDRRVTGLFPPRQLPGIAVQEGRAADFPSENVAHDSAKAIVSAGCSIWASAAATTPEFLSGFSPRLRPSSVRRLFVMA
jgi:hypothetical protein